MQTDAILELLKAGPVTPMDALQRAGCMRLGARIWELRQMGHPIVREWYETPTGKRVARYSLQTEPRLKALSDFGYVPPDDFGGAA
jgi:hypothetical protein